MGVLPKIRRRLLTTSARGRKRKRPSFFPLKTDLSVLQLICQAYVFAHTRLTDLVLEFLFLRYSSSQSTFVINHISIAVADWWGAAEGAEEEDWRPPWTRDKSNTTRHWLWQSLGVIATSGKNPCTGWLRTGERFQTNPAYLWVRARESSGTTEKYTPRGILFGLIDFFLLISHVRLMFRSILSGSICKSSIRLWTSVM